MVMLSLLLLLLQLLIARSEAPPVAVIPAPQQWTALPGTPVALSNATVILADLADPVAAATAARLQDTLHRCCGARPALRNLPALDAAGTRGSAAPTDFIALGGRGTPGLAALLPRDVAWPRTPPAAAEGYALELRAGPGGDPRVFLLGNSAVGEFYATQTLVQLANNSAAHEMPRCRIDDWPDSRVRGYYMWEQQTNDINMPWIAWLLDTMSAHKMNFGFY